VSHEMNQAVGPGVPKGEPSSNYIRSTQGSERGVSKPVSESHRIDPRQFQLNQLRRRFSPVEKDERDATALSFELVPTDPDFPFEMTGLSCSMLVPYSYPDKGQPSLRVINPEMGRGYQINVERGFESLAAAMPKSTLLALVNELDKRLEGFLTSEQAQTVKLVTNTGKKTSVKASTSKATPEVPVAVSTSLEASSLSALPKHTPQQIAETKAKRESEIRQLEARMGRQPLFSKSSDGLSFSVPLQIPNSSKLPVSLQSVRSIKLFVPLSYNFESCSVLLVDVSSDEADAVRVSFQRHAAAHPEMTLMAHVNHLAQNMHTMALEVSTPAPEIPKLPPSSSVETAPQISKDLAARQLEDRPHVQIIPRPPEWDNPRDEEVVHSDSSGADNSEDESPEYDTDDDGGTAIPFEAQLDADTGPDLGILLSFPSLELYGAELLQLYSISLTVKCDRCKDMKDVKNVRPHAPGDNALVKHESCNKCANQLGIGGLS
jgi:hypothetical protein